MLAFVESLQQVVTRQRRLAIGWTEVREDQSVLLGYGIPGLANAIAQTQSAFGLARLFQAAAFRIEKPAVIAAADSLFFHSAVIEAGAAVRAARINQAGLAGAVAEQNQILAQSSNLPRA